MSGAGPIPSSGRTELDRLRQAVSTYFPVYETRLGPQSVVFAVHVDAGSLEEKFDRLRRDLDSMGYIPILRREMGEEFVEVIRRPRTGPRRLWINLLLLAATVGTTVFTGGVLWLSYVGQVALTAGDFLYGALFFAAPLLLILGVHESAHYVVARRRHLDASLPYFIPFPYLLGTMGAFVSIRGPFPDRKSLFDVGAAGPIAGLVMSIPISLLGLSLSVHSPVLPVTYCAPSIVGQNYGNILIGPSLLWTVLTAFFPSSIVSLHPLAIAGWVGILVTAINLLPAGPLDGSHVFRAVFGERARYVSYAAAAGLFAIGFFYVGWWLYAIIVLFLGLRHPPPLNDTSRLDGKRIAVAGAVTLILVSGFVLIPFSAAGAISLSPSTAKAGTAPPGAAFADYLNVSVRNDDPEAHGFAYTYSIANVSVSPEKNLNASSLATWEASARWTIGYPNGTSANFTGASVSLPASEYLTIAGYASDVVSVEFSNSQAAVAAGFTFSTSELCASSAGGSASTGFTATFT